MLKTNWLAIQKESSVGGSLGEKKYSDTSESSNVFICKVSAVELTEARSSITTSKTFCFLMEYSKKIVNQ